MTTYATRTQAAAHAKRKTNNFRTRRAINRAFWEYFSVPSQSPTLDADLALCNEWAATRDYVAWVETHFQDQGRKPGHLFLFVVTCPREEIPSEDFAMVEGMSGAFDPILPSIWNSNDREADDMTPSADSKPRAKSDVESPTKLVWAIADEMTGADKAAVIAACVEKGVNKSTAQTQYYRWAKAKKG